MTIYRVTGTSRYRDHEPGTVFVGLLPPEAEARAVARGSIEIVERGRVSLDPSRAVLPRGWDQRSST